MKARVLVGACAVALLVAPGMVSAVVLYGPDDMSSAVGWTINAASGDDTATFGYDYSADGIPSAPGGSGTVGAKLESNTTDGAGLGGVVITPTGFTASGIYRVTADVWMNYGFSGGTTEYTGMGVGYDGTTAPQDNGGGSGGRLLMVSDASSARDYRMYKNLTPGYNAGGEQFVASGQYSVSTNNNTSGDFDAISPSVDVGVAPLDVQGQTGTTPLGGPSFNWHTVEITVHELAGLASFEIDGLLLGMLDASVGPTDFGKTGAISFSHSDRYSSINSPAGLAFAIFDNVVVTDIPEPTSLALLAIGGVALLRRRR